MKKKKGPQNYPHFPRYQGMLPHRRTKNRQTWKVNSRQEGQVQLIVPNYITLKKRGGGEKNFMGGSKMKKNVYVGKRYSILSVIGIAFNANKILFYGRGGER